MSRQKKVRLIKKVWLAFFIIMILNNAIGETILTFAQPSPLPNPFFQYIPGLLPLGYLLAGVLFVLGLIAYRKDYSYAILLISAGSLVAGLLNYSVYPSGGTQGNITVVPVHINLEVLYNGQIIASNGHTGSLQAPFDQNFEVCYSTSPAVPVTTATWYEGNTIYKGIASGNSSFNGTYQTSEYFAGTNTIIVVVDDVIGNKLYYGYAYVQFRYVPSLGTIYQDVMYALTSVSGISPFVAGSILFYQFLTNAVTDAINNLILTPTLGGNGANADAGQYYSYFESIANALGFILIALGIGINALKGGYSDLVDLGMDFFYRSGVFLLFSYGGIQIFNAVANSLNMIAQSIIDNVLGELSNTLASWTLTAIGMMLGSNFVGFGFGRTLANLSTLVFEVDMAIFIASYIRVVMILALASMIPLLVAMWTFEWTRGIALALAEVLAGLVFGGLVDALLLYFIVQVGGIAFFLFAPATILAMLMTGLGTHQIAKSVGLGVASKSSPAIPSISIPRPKDNSKNNNNQPQQQNVPITQVVPQSPQQSQNVQPQNIPSVTSQPPVPQGQTQQLTPQTPQQTVSTQQFPVPQGQTQQLTSQTAPTLQTTQKVQGFASTQTTTNPTSVPIQQAMQQLGAVSTIRLNNGNKYATVRAVQGGYQITKGIKTDQGAVEKTYTIPAYASIEEVASGVRENFVDKGQTEINPEVIGAFFKSLESNNTPSTENVKTTNLR